MGALERCSCSACPGARQVTANRPEARLLTAILWFSDKSEYNRGQFGHSGALQATNAPEFGQAAPLPGRVMSAQLSMAVPSGLKLTMRQIRTAPGRRV
jgi:hypothetical protein